MKPTKAKTTKATVKPKRKAAAVAPGSASAPPKLTDKQRVFVEYYLQSFNATDAARKAGYADPELSGWENRQKQVIKDEIERRLSAVAMDADEVLMRLAAMARGSLDPFMLESDDDVWPDLTSDKAKANRHLLKKIKPKRRVGGPPEDRWAETEIELEIHDPLRALELIGKHHKLFTDKVEHSGPNEGPIKHEDVGAYRGMDRNDLNRGIEQALKSITGS
jgi:phage terminase small subunit